MTSYRYYVLDCDVCRKVLGRTTDNNYSGRGITLCTECWDNPADLPRHIKSSITLDQVARVSSD